MKIIKRFVKQVEDFFRIFNKIVKGREILPYADLKKFWDYFFYAFAISGASLIFLGKIIGGLVLVVCSYLFFAKALRYEYSKTKASELNKAIYNQDIKTIEYLLKKGFDPNKIDGFGNPPLMCAIKHGGNAAPKIIDLLIQHDAKIKESGNRVPLKEAILNINILFDDKKDQSVALSRNLEIVRQLIVAEDKNWRSNEQLIEILNENDLYDKLLESS